MPTAVYLGNFSLPFCTECHIAASLADLGWDVVELQEDRTSIDDIRRACDGADLLLYTRTPGFWKGSQTDLLRFIDAAPIPSASVHLDLFAGLKRGAGLRDDPFWRTRYVFSADGGSEAFFAAAGINHHWLRAGVYGRECYLAAPDSALASDVCFVGSGAVHGSTYHPEWPYRDRLVRWLATTYGDRFRKHGGPPHNGGLACARGHELNRVYASAKVVVGDTLCLGPGDAKTPPFTHVRYYSDRAYETMGRGGFLIHPWIEGMEEEFTDREHIVYYRYGDFAQLRSLIDHYLAHDDERERIRLAGHERVKARCTYVHRAREMLDVIAASEPALRERMAA